MSLEVMQSLLFHVLPSEQPATSLSTVGSAVKLTVLLSAAATVGITAYTSAQAISSYVRCVLAARELDKQGLHRPSSTLPVLGNTLDVMFYHKHRFHDWMTDQSRASGGKPWVLSIIGRPPTVVHTSPEACKDIFKTQFDVFERGPALLDLSRDFFGNGIVGVDGEEWARQRRIASHLFSMHIMRDVMSGVVIEKTGQLCDVLSACARAGRTASMRTLIATFTGDVITKLGFGVDLNGFEGARTGNVDHDQPIISALAFYGGLFQTRLQTPAWFWKLKRFLNLGDERQFKKRVKVVHDMTHEVMMESLANKATNKGDATKRDLLSLFMQSHGVKDIMTTRDTLMNFFLAGKDTMAFSMSWFLVMMNRHPRVLKKIREEIRTNLPDLGKRVPTMEELSKLPYLEAAIKESFRLHMSIIYRTPNRSTTVVDGTFVPSGASIMVSVYASARMTSIWGVDAEEYRPERFIDEDTGKLKVVSPFKFITFLCGPRQCPGMRLAMLEMKTAMATLMHRFDLATVEDPFAITYDSSLVLPVKGPLMVTVRELPTAKQ